MAGLELTGNVSNVERAAARYAEIADAIAHTATALKRISDPDDIIAKSVESLRKSADYLHGRVSDSESRYRTTGEALKVYSAGLADAQAKAHTALAAVSGASASVSSAERQVDQYEQKLLIPGPDQAADQQSLTVWKQKLQDAQASMGGGQAQYDEAVADKEAAATAAAGKIHDLVEDSPLNDGVWDNVRGVWDGVVKVLDVIATVAGVLAVFLSWVPGLGQLLLVIAVIGALVKLVDSIIKANKTGDWGSVVGASIGLVLTAFGGKILTVLGKVGRAKAVLAAPAAAKSTGKSATQLLGVGTRNYTRTNALKTIKNTRLENPFKMKSSDFTFQSWQKAGKELSVAKFLGVKDGWKLTSMSPGVQTQMSVLPFSVGVLALEYRSLSGKADALIKGTDGAIDGAAPGNDVQLTDAVRLKWVP